MRLNLTECFPASASGLKGPLPKQAEFMRSVLDPKGPKYTLYCGGIGCISGGTLIQTPLGNKKLTDLRLSDALSFSGTSFYAPASVPYPVGKTHLYQVVHAHGQFSAAGFHLVFCADGKYRRVDQLEAGQKLLLNLPSQAATTSAPSPSKLPASALDWKQRVSGFLNGCLECYRQYDQLPPEALSIAQDIVPLLSDALGYIPSGEHLDDLQALAQARIHPGRLCSLLSSLDSSLQQAVQLSCEEDLVLEESSELLLQNNRVMRQSLLKSALHQLIPEPLDNLLISFPLNPLSYSSTVFSITRESQESWYWDITVPGADNYVDSSGLIHHNSGKTMIGCITMLSLAVLYPGDYLICRQFLPELKLTTLKAFLEICPKELIDEYRVADGIVKIRASGGKVSNIIFRQLEEPDKHRSLNLSGFYIDESSQVSEAAFMLLQGRLRGPGLRKGFLTTNPNGHDWQYQWFVKQDLFHDTKTKHSFRLIKAPSTENVHLPEGYIASIMQTWSPERIKREIEGSFDAFEGMVYHEFRRDLHVIQPFVIPPEWTRVIGIDHGYRNPSAWIWGAIDYDENIYIYREFYEREWLIEEIVRGNKKQNKPGVLQMMRGEKIEQARMDPSTRAVRGTSGLSDWDTYMDFLPKDFPLLPANNEKTAGIDRVKSYLKVNPATNKPRLFIFNTCPNLIDEMSRYRYKELTHGQHGQMNEKEEPMKVDDHANDALRYLVMSRPEPPKQEDNIWSRLKYNSPEGALYRDLQAIKAPKIPSDPWE